LNKTHLNWKNYSTQLFSHLQNNNNKIINMQASDDEEGINTNETLSQN